MSKRRLTFLIHLLVIFTISIAATSSSGIELQAMPDQTRSIEIPPPAVGDPLETPLIISVNMISGDIPGSPLSVVWNDIDSVRVPLSGQIVAVPKNFNPSVRWVEVKAVSNAKEIAIYVTWQDGTRDESFLKSEEFKDAVALQFPVIVTKLPEKPHFAMGNTDEVVNIWHWKAEWDKDRPGMADMEDAYPYMAMGSGGYYVYEPQFNEPLSRRVTWVDHGMGKDEGVFNAGIAAGNIFSDVSKRTSPVEDLNAEGFGTLTTQKGQDVKGRGIWLNGEWSVVFLRPLSTPDPYDTQLDRWDEYVPVAFAVWDGSNGERDGIKSISGWHYLKIK